MRDRTHLGTVVGTELNVSSFENIEESKDTSPIVINQQGISRAHGYTGLRETGPTNAEPTVGDASSIMIRDNNDDIDNDVVNELGSSGVLINNLNLSRQNINQNF